MQADFPLAIGTESLLKVCREEYFGGDIPATNNHDFALSMRQVAVAVSTH